MFIATFLQVGAILLSISMLMIGNGLQSLLLPLRADVSGFSDGAIGVMGSLYFAGFILGCLHGPVLIRRVGHIRCYAATVALASAIALGHVLLLHEVTWWLMRAGTGYTIAVAFLVVESWLNTQSNNTNRGMIMSLYMVMNMMATMIGQMLLLTDSVENFRLFALASIIVSLAALPIALTRSSQPGQITQVKLNLRQLLETSPAGTVGCFTIGIINGVFWALAPLFTTESGLSGNQSAVFMTVTLIGGALMQWPVGKLSDKIDRRLVLMGLMVLTGVNCALLVMLNQMMAFTHLEMQVFGLVFGMSAMTAYGVAIAHANDHADPSQSTTTAAGLLLVYSIGATLGPLVAGQILAVIGVVAIPIIQAIAALVFAAYLAYRMLMRAAVRGDDKMDFAESPAGFTTAIPATVATLAEEDVEPETKI